MNLRVLSVASTGSARLPLTNEKFKLCPKLPGTCSLYLMNILCDHYDCENHE